ncbi:MAG: class F sortase [Patescibacteria group bacterium]
MINQKRKNNRLKTALIFVAIFVGAGVSYIAVATIYSSLQPKPAVATKTTNSDAPDAAIEATDETEVPVSTIDSYTVAPTMPRFLKIEKLDMKARVQPMGINSVGAVQAPVNIYDSGWYTGSARPGTAGAAFIDGHASGSTRQGLFAYLDTLKNGDSVSIEQGDGAVFNYKVVHIETVARDAVDMNKALAVYGGAAEGLNLMTCTGKWIADQDTYDKRVIVYTERVS